jgi:NAD(P)-dependent dehydrogenase (short-subunit alcohol dehydrogenase family)
MNTSKTIVITGASGGIGAAAARALVRDGHHVVIVGRSPHKTDQIARELEVDSFVVDFANLADVRRLAADLDAAYPKIDVLANNAGGIFGDQTKTVDGFEKTFQVNSADREADLQPCRGHSDLELWCTSVRQAQYR